MIGSLIVLLCYQLVGEIITRSLGLPVPGPVLGMLLLFATLLARGSVPQQLQRTSQGILHYLSLLFVPAGVGVIVYIGQIRNEWLAITTVLLVSTALTVAITALALQGLRRIVPARRQQKEAR